MPLVGQQLVCVCLTGPRPVQGDGNQDPCYPKGYSRERHGSKMEGVGSSQQCATRFQKRSAKGWEVEAVLDRCASCVNNE